MRRRRLYPLDMCQPRSKACPRLAFMGTPRLRRAVLAELIASGEIVYLSPTAAPQGPGSEADAVAGSRLRRGLRPAGLHA